MKERWIQNGYEQRDRCHFFVFLLSWNFKFIQLNDYKKYVLDQRALLRIEKQILDRHTLYQNQNH